MPDTVSQIELQNGTEWRRPRGGREKEEFVSDRGHEWSLESLRERGEEPHWGLSELSS
jgi:hypothetical protein